MENSKANNILKRKLQLAHNLILREKNFPFQDFPLKSKKSPYTGKVPFQPIEHYTYLFKVNYQITLAYKTL